MCLILVAVEKYPFTDQWHFTSGAHWKGRECDIQGRAPLSFCFSTKSRTGYRAPVVPKPEPGECDAPASGRQDRQLSLLTPSTHHWGGQEGLTIFPVRQIPEDYWWPSRLELKSHYFPHSWAKATESREFLSTVLAPCTIPASVFTENKQLCIVPLWQVNAW